MRLRALTLAAAVLWQAATHVTPEPRYFRFERSVQTTGVSGTRTCAALDASTYAHGAPDLTDLRLFANGAEVPYALTLSDTATLADASAQVLNAGLHGGRLVFDLAMPPLPYSSVELQLDGSNFFGEARVTGLKSINSTAGTALGTFNLYDLAAQRLGHSTTLNLQESTFPFLHVEIEARRTASAGSQPGATILSPQSLRGAVVPPSRAAQTVYTTLAETSTITQRNADSVAIFQVPARVPVERVSFALKPGAPNFSRDLTILARLPGGDAPRPDGTGEEALAGTISRVHLPAATAGATDGRSIQPIDREQLSVPAVLGLNSRQSMQVEVDVLNGDDRPLPIAAVRLEMRQREVCFDAQPDPVSMFYGDSALSAPVYDYARTFNVGGKTNSATLGPETLNPAWTPRPQPRAALTERHPELLWIALLIVIGALGFVAFRSARTTGKPRT